MKWKKKDTNLDFKFQAAPLAPQGGSELTKIKVILFYDEHWLNIPKTDFWIDNRGVNSFLKLGGGAIAPQILAE